MKLVKVELAKLKRSHVRDWTVDPLEYTEAKALVNSINEHGFWGGVVLSKGDNGDYEVLAGSKRVYAAQEAGITHVELYVGEYTDRQAIRVYASENITQRGVTAGLAMAGAVASAVRYIAKEILKGNDTWGIHRVKQQKNNIEDLHAALAGEKGVGRELILGFYKGIDGINENLVKEHLANLKASGDYGRIIKEVTEEVDREHAEEVAELERKQREAEEKQQTEEAAKAEAEKKKAEAKAAKAKKTGQKAAKAAGSKPKTFDLTGVGKFLTNQHQLKTFRKIVERESVRKHLPIEKQAELAEALVKKATEDNAEISAYFIEGYVGELFGTVVREATKEHKKAVEEMEREDVLIRWSNTSHDFCRKVGWLNKLGRDMIKMKNKHPDLPFGITQELRNAVTYAQPVINELAAKIGIN